MTHTPQTLVSFLRLSVGNLVKVERMLQAHPSSSHRSNKEYQFENIPEELSNIITEILQATSKCFETCKNLRDKDFVDNLKL